MDDGDGDLRQLSQDAPAQWQAARETWTLDATKTQRSLPEQPVLHTNFREGN